LPISLRRARTLHAIFKREYLRTDNSIRNLASVVTRRSVSLWDRQRRHAMVPFPSYVGFHNRTRAIDLLRNLAARSIEHKVYPLPYGIEDRFRGSVNGQPACELSCLLNCHAPERAQFVQRLRELSLPSTYIGQTAIEPEDVQRLVAMGAVNPETMRPVELGHNPRYYQQIRDSRRCISVPGGGFDTLRFWEILAQGALLVSKRVGIEMPHALAEGRHYLAFDTFAELRHVLESSFADPGSADRIRQSGHEFAMHHHTTRARALYVLKTLANLGLLAQPLPE
jgi:hypothetical protein